MKLLYTQQTPPMEGFEQFHRIGFGFGVVCGEGKACPLGGELCPDKELPFTKMKAQYQFVFFLAKSSAQLPVANCFCQILAYLPYEIVGEMHLE